MSMPEPSEWLISPDLTEGARLQVSSLIEAEELTPEVLELLAKFMKKLRRLDKAPPTDPCPKLETCQTYSKPCTVLTSCGSFSVKAASF
jgi:hypothetical protein